MKIILLQDEKKLGKKGEIIEASEGYARNYILQKKIGVEASSKNLNDLKLHKACLLYTSKIPPGPFPERLPCGTAAA